MRSPICVLALLLTRISSASPKVVAVDVNGIVHPVTVEIAELAGRIEGEQAAVGVSIAFEDLLIGTTALHLGYALATLNVRHFQIIPGLQVIQP